MKVLMRTSSLLLGLVILAIAISALQSQLQNNKNSFYKSYFAVKEIIMMENLMKQLELIAKSHATVLITGESGTGKEVLARKIHQFSKRASLPFIAVNCAAVAETLMEAEFFGHERGAFTGAHLQRLGRFERASGGTLLLDEVTEIPLHLQPKLLRVIQEQELERVGGSRTVKVDVRLIATSNQDVKEAVREKKFREDLFYRLNVVPLHLPPLRERKGEIIPLATHFLGSGKRLTERAKERLLEYPWPGNIRELANIMERAALLSEGEMIDVGQLFF